MIFQGICLVTEDVLALAAFYEKVLQTTYEGDSTHAELKTQGASLAIYNCKAAEEDMKLCFEAGRPSYTINFLVEDVDKEYARLQDLGVEFLTEPTTYSWGARSMQFKDEVGNVVNFACRLVN